MKNSLPPVHHFDVQRMVDRLHVDDSLLSVVRYVMSRLSGGRKGALKMPKKSRRYLVAASIQSHKQNRHQYSAVMYCEKGEFVPAYLWDKETQSVVRA